MINSIHPEYQFISRVFTLLCLASLGLGCASAGDAYDSGTLANPSANDPSSPTLPGQMDRPDRNDPPLFKRIGTRQLEVGVPFDLTVEVFDPDGDRLMLSAEGLPEGSILDGVVFRFQWTPTVAQRGAHEVVFIANDGQLEAREMMMVMVVGQGEAMNLAPEVEIINELRGFVGEEINLRLPATDPNGDRLTFQLLPGSPNGVSILSDGILLWTPTAMHAGQRWTIQYQVSDGAFGTRGEITFLIFNSTSPSDPMDPAPMDPDPMDPDPMNPDPMNPDPMDPDPMDPDPMDPDPMDPDPMNPDPMDPDPMDPDPMPLPCSSIPPSTFGLSWMKLGGLNFEFSVTPIDCLQFIDYYVDDVYIGSASAAEGGRLSSNFSSGGTTLLVEAVGFGGSGGVDSYAQGYMDLLEGQGVYIRHTRDRTYAIGVERASAQVAQISVAVDGFMLTDLRTGAQMSDGSLEVEYLFMNIGARSFVFYLYDQNGAEIEQISRTFNLID